MSYTRETLERFEKERKAAEDEVRVERMVKCLKEFKKFGNKTGLCMDETEQADIKEWGVFKDLQTLVYWNVWKTAWKKSVGI